MRLGPKTLWLVLLRGNRARRETLGGVHTQRKATWRGSKKVALRKDRSLRRNLPASWPWTASLSCVVTTAPANCHRWLQAILLSAPRSFPISSALTVYSSTRHNLLQESSFLYWQRHLTFANFVSIFIDKETTTAGEQDSRPLTRGRATQTPPATSPCRAQLECRHGRKVEAKCPGVRCPGFAFQRSSNAEKWRKKKCHFNSPIFVPPPNYWSCSQGGADPILKNFDKLPAPFIRLKGSQWDLVTLSVHTKLFRTIQYGLILYGAPFTREPRWKLTHPVFNHIWVI